MSIELHTSHLRRCTQSFIRAAKSRVLVASYLVLEPGLSTDVSWSQATEKRVIYNAATSSGDTRNTAKVRWFDPRGCAMHHKFIIADDRVLFGSYNFQETEEYNHVAVSDEAAHVKQFLQQFEAMWVSAKDEAGPGPLRGEAATQLIQQAVTATGGWDKYTTGLSKYLRERGRLTPRQVATLFKIIGREATDVEVDDD